jgi:hypothetical protein
MVSFAHAATSYHLCLAMLATCPGIGRRQMIGGSMSAALDEIAAAKDYWGQLFERYARNPLATLVARDEIVVGAEERAKVLLAARGVPPEQIDALAAQFSADLSNAPVTSPGVDPHVEIIFNGLCDRVEAAIAEVSKSGPVRVARGIEPQVGVFAARLGVMMTDASVITVGSQIFRFCNVVGKALTTTIMIDPGAWDTIDDLQALRALLRSRPDAIRYWVDILVSFSFTGSSVNVPFVTLPKEWNALKDRMVDAVEIFVVAHEYSHHLMRHGRLLEASTNSGADSRARGEEFEADSIAIMIGQMVTGHLPDENLLMISGAGMVVLLSALDMLARARRLLGLEVKEDRGSHPSAADRFAMIDRQEHLWGHEVVQLRVQRSAYVRMMGVIANEVLPIIEVLAGTDEFREAAQRTRKLFAGEYI